MEYAPSVHWGLMRRVARRSAGALPDLSRGEVETLVADLRTTARRAGTLAGQFLKLDSVGATDIRVVDWAGWGRAVNRMADEVVTELDLPERPRGVSRSARGLGNGVLAGVAIGKVSRHLLGQYDAFTGDQALYLVAPTILQHERRHGFVPADFRLWVALHEQTHALQFHAAPWLRDYVRERMRSVTDDDANLVESLATWREQPDLISLFTSREARGQLDEMNAAMTFLEGHADLVSDTVGMRHARTVATMRKAFARPKATGRLARLVEGLGKQAQYRDGLAFCRTVVRRHSWTMLGRALQAPENLPTMGEIAEPQKWINRVRG